MKCHISFQFCRVLMMVYDIPEYSSYFGYFPLPIYITKHYVLAVGSASETQCLNYANRWRKKSTLECQIWINNTPALYSGGLKFELHRTHCYPGWSFWSLTCFLLAGVGSVSKIMPLTLPVFSYKVNYSLNHSTWSQLLTALLNKP